MVRDELAECPVGVSDGCGGAELHEGGEEAQRLEEQSGV